MFTRKPFPAHTRTVISAVLLAVNLQASAQFIIMPGEKSSTLWTEITTSNYQVIYPDGYDSLGIRYATILEKYRPLVGYTAGYLPNQQFNTSLPVVLHPYTAITNGASVLAPRRIEMFTFSDPYSSLPPISWETLVSIHESRHAAQSQFAATGFWKGFRKVFGEASMLLVDNLHLNPALAEGDAVVAETALTSSGRGRTADFLSYYRMAFDNGDMRNWYRWRYGSQKYYTPDLYRVGYMTVAGTRYLYDAPMFMSDYLYKISFPFRFNAMSSTMRKYSGKRFSNTWADITSVFASVWKADDRERGPFQEITPVVMDDAEYYPVYSGTVETAGGSLLAVRNALDKASELVEILPDGTVRTIRPFKADSKLVYSALTGCIYWSEAVPDMRWEMYQSSPVRMMRVGDKKISDLTSGGRYVNPTVSDDGRYLAAVEYLVEGGCRIVLLDLSEGREIRSITAGSRLQVNEVAFTGSDILFTGVDDDGMGLYLTDFTSVRTLEEAVPFKVHDLISRDGVVYFTSDKNGTEEIYSYTPGNGQGGVLKQLTNTRYGVSGPFFRDDRLCFIAMLPQGRVPSFSSVPFGKEVSYSDHATYPIADKLTEQESLCPDNIKRYLVFSPARYSKEAHFLNFHSWIPIYYSMDGITGSMTGFANEVASLGFKAFFQNPTSTVSGSLGISLNTDPFEVNYQLDDDAPEGTGYENLKLALHGRVDYTGLFPVFSFAFDAGSRNSVNTVMGIDLDDGLDYPASVKSSSPFMGGSMTVSLPFNFSSSGWERYLTPFASVLASNDKLGEGYRAIRWNDKNHMYEPSKQVKDGLHSHVRYAAGITGSIERPVPSSGVYPRLGIGGGVQYSGNPFTRAFYASLYGYLPGMTTVQGLKLSASMQSRKASSGNTPADVWAFESFDMAPRGLIGSSAESILKHYYRNTYKIGFDYAMPVLPVDLSLGHYVYMRNMELIPFCDYMVAEKERSDGYLYSAGADLLFRFEKFLFVNNTMKVGLRYSYNGGSLFHDMGLEEPNSIGLVTGLTF
ncbi:MAG: hypothetical protein J5869_01440 [Bacteroidaceae bacterium]|nr:hypothetical protein [Bacteroidaceae bacterium]